MIQGDMHITSDQQNEGQGGVENHRRLPLPSLLLRAYCHYVGHHESNGNTSPMAVPETDNVMDTESSTGTFESPEDMISQSIFSLIDVMTKTLLQKDDEFRQQHKNFLQQSSNLDRDTKVIPMMCFQRAFQWFDVATSSLEEQSSPIMESCNDEYLHNNTSNVCREINAAISLWKYIMFGFEDKQASINQCNVVNDIDDPKLSRLAPHEVIRLSLEALSIISSSSSHREGGYANDSDDDEEERYNKDNLDKTIKMIVEQSFATVVVLELQTLALKVAVSEINKHRKNNNNDDVSNVVNKDKRIKKTKIRWRRLTSMVEQNLETLYKGIILPMEEFCDSISSFHRWFQLHLEATEYRKDDPNMIQLRWLSQTCYPALQAIHHIISSSSVQIPLQLTSEISKHYSRKGMDDQKVESKLLSETQRVPLSACIAFVGLISQFIDVASKIQTMEMECTSLLIQPIDGGGVVDVEVSEALTEQNTANRKVDVSSCLYVSLMDKLTSLIFVDIPCIMLHEILLQSMRLEYMTKQEERAEQRMTKKRTTTKQRPNDAVVDTFEEENLTLFQNRMERFRTNTSRLFTERAAIQWNVKGIALAVHFLMSVAENTSDNNQQKQVEQERHTFITKLPHWYVYSPTMKWCFLWPQISVLLTHDESFKAFQLSNMLNRYIPQDVNLGCWNYSRSTTTTNNKAEKLQCQATTESGLYYVKPSTEGVMGLVSTMQLWFNVITKNSTTTSSNNSTNSLSSEDNGKIIQLLKSFVRRVNDPSVQVDCIQLLLDRSPYPRLKPMLLDFLRIPVMKVDNRKDFYFTTRLNVLNLLKPNMDEMEDYCKDSHDDISKEAMHHQLIALMDSYETYQATISLLDLLTRNNIHDKTDHLTSHTSEDKTIEESTEKVKSLLNNYISIAKKLGRKLSFQLVKKQQDGNQYIATETKDINPLGDIMSAVSPNADPFISPPPELVQESLFRLNLLLHSVDTLNEV